jgi:hypothetical protein
MNVRMYVHRYMYLYVHAEDPPCMHACMHVCMYVCMHVCTYAHVRTGTCEINGTRWLALNGFDVVTYIHTHIYIHTDISTYIHTYSLIVLVLLVG